MAGALQKGTAMHLDAYQFCLAEEARCSNTTECCVDLIQPNPYCLSPPAPPS